jgi:acetyl esterase/lipase
MGSAFGYRPLAGALALAADASVVLPEYRLAPEHPFPAAIEDTVRAYLWMVDSGVAPDQITVGGDSAGAGLVMALLLVLRQDELPLPGGAALLCPGIDLSYATIDELPAPTEPQPALSLDQLQSFVESYLAGHPLDDPLVSPLEADLTGLPPLLVQGATGDIFVGDARRLAARARSHGVDVRLELYPVATHDFHVFWSFLPEAASAVQQAGEFAREVRSTGEAAAAIS